MYIDPLLSMFITMSTVAAVVCFVILVASSVVSRDEQDKGD